LELPCSRRQFPATVGGRQVHVTHVTVWATNHFSRGEGMVAVAVAVARELGGNTLHRPHGACCRGVYLPTSLSQTYDTYGISRVGRRQHPCTPLLDLLRETKEHFIRTSCSDEPWRVCVSAYSLVASLNLSCFESKTASDSNHLERSITMSVFAPQNGSPPTNPYPRPTPGLMCIVKTPLMA
jgi:hypothetical protein